ncbi:hypothetical protein ACI2LV_34165 [Streptomyces fungicidicus]|uniref:hypothetical protein n=1 Tax=Streptomyces fungicidicus TaxID=68203 RepID=UPI00384A4EAF
MGAVPVSAALLVQVALDATGSGMSAWARLRSILDSWRSNAVSGDLDADVLEELAEAPFNVSTAQALSAQLAERAAASTAFREELAAWAHSVWQAHSAEPSEDGPDGTAIGAAISQSRHVEPQFAVFGMADSVAGDPLSGAFSNS